MARWTDSAARLSRRLLVLLINVTVFLICDVLVSRFVIAGSSLDRYAARVDVNRNYRVADERFHHALRPGYSGPAAWGGSTYRMTTNDLGFRDATARKVDRQPPRPRVLFIGDSFAEGIGLPWEETSVGRFAAAVPSLEVLNAGVVSYSPTIYDRKVQWLLDGGYRIDHVVVLIDISDIQDETWYHIGEDGKLHYAYSRTLLRQESARTRWRRRVQSHFQVSMSVLHGIKGLFAAAPPPPAPITRGGVFQLCRGAWTHRAADPEVDRHYASGQRQVGLEQFTARCAKSGPTSGVDVPLPGGNIEAAVARAVAAMDRLHRRLASEGVKLSVAVYPWPAQLERGEGLGLQSRIWQAWCRDKCVRFIDMYPAFAAKKRLLADDWYRALYFEGDVHFSAAGSAVVAEALLAALRPTLP